MRTSPFLSGGLLLTCFFASAPIARAEMINWYYVWDRTPKQIAADPAGPGSAGTGSINLFPPQSGAATNTSDIIAFNLSTSSRAPDTKGNPDRYTNQGYQATLTVYDGTPANPNDPTQLAKIAHQSVTFAGTINGTVTVDSVNLHNTFASTVSQQLLIGSHVYSISLNPFTEPSPPGAKLLGAVGAHVVVSDPVTQTAPEPSTLLLAALGCGGSLAAAWRKRRRAAV